MLKFNYVFYLKCFIFMKFNKLNIPNRILFKRRNYNKINNFKLYFGNIAFFIFQSIQFEFIYFFLIKRVLKFFFKFKYITCNYFKIWINLTANFPISYKSKNSRMGKGKGFFNRWSIKLNQNSILIEFKNINYIRVKLLSFYWNKFLKINIYIFKIK